MADNTMFNLNAHVPFLLYRLASKLSSEANVRFKAAGVNTQSARILMVLLSNESATVTELCAATSIEQPTLSRILIRFVRDGLVTKQREDSDNRTVRVRLTAKGRGTAHQCGEIGLVYERKTLHSFSTAEANILRDMLREMYRNLAEMPDSASAGQPVNGAAARLGKDAAGNGAGDPLTSSD